MSVQVLCFLSCVAVWWCDYTGLRFNMDTGLVFLGEPGRQLGAQLAACACLQLGSECTGVRILSHSVASATVSHSEPQ